MHETRIGDGCRRVGSRELGGTMDVEDANASPGWTGRQDVWVWRRQMRVRTRT